MTLLVHPYTRKADGTFESVETEYVDRMAGFESCRTDLWGHEAARSLGLVLLPSLADDDVYAEGVDLDLLEREVQTLLANQDRLAQTTGYAADYIESRCGNFLRAIAQARALCGGVYIG
jgi:hypothetical protein